MKKLLFLCMTIFALSYTTAQVTAYQVGDVVDNFTVTDTQGVEHTLYDITATGKYVFLDFFFTTCPPCQQTQRHFNHLHDKYGCNEGDLYTLSLSTLASDTNALIDQFEATYGGEYNHSPAAGGEGGAPAVCDQFGVNAYPTYAIVGPDNTLVVADIWPITDITTFEANFPDGFNPEPMECSIMGASDILANGFSVYPTVSDGNFNVTLSNSSDSEINIYDMTGKKVFNGSYHTKDVNVNVKLPPGIYILNVNTEGKSSSKKIIIRN